jgi:hypothetical protein
MGPYISCRMAYITFPFTIFRFECQRKEFITCFELEPQGGRWPSESFSATDFDSRTANIEIPLVGGEVIVDNGRNAVRLWSWANSFGVAA